MQKKIIDIELIFNANGNKKTRNICALFLLRDKSADSDGAVFAYRDGVAGVDGFQKFVAELVNSDDV